MVRSHNSGWIQCCITGCTNAIRDRAWSRIKADGWFQSKDGAIFCPEHVPDWVEAWREKRRKGGVK